MKKDQKILLKDEIKPVVDDAQDEQKQDNFAKPKNRRPTAKVYFKEMISTRENLIAFIQSYLAPAVHGRTLPNVSGAYYGAVAKNTCETATDIVHNTTCNYRAFKKALGIYSITPKELSELLKIEIKYKPEKKVKNKPKSKKEAVLNVLNNKLDGYIADTEKLELLVQSIYTELRPIINKSK